jgi:FKBP-type peptidyl-prolyl cis-trans isomerase
MMKSTPRIMIAAFLFAACSGGSRDATLDTFSDSASYAIGMNMAASLGPAKGDVSLDALLSGFEDFYNEAELEIEPNGARQVIEAFIAEIQQQEQADLAAQTEVNLQEGSAYREENGARPGVTTTASGLQIEVLEEGTGAQPGDDARVTVHYRGMLIDGTEFDSSYERDEPYVTSLNAVIGGWTEGLQLMKAGGRYRLVIPPELGYGPQGSPPAIGPNATLVFEIELIDFEG